MSYIENMDKRTKLRTLCETRWTSRSDALYTFKASFPIVVHALERLQGLGDDKAGQYLASITRFVFVIALVVSEHSLQSTMFLSKFLQGIECDLLEATKECKTVIELLRAERLDESVWDELYQSALDLSEPFDIVENMPRRCGIKVITKLPNSEQSYKGKVKTHNYINRQNQSTTGKL